MFNDRVEHADAGVCVADLLGEVALGVVEQVVRRGEPVALLCTSGTAAANFLPAVVEAGRQAYREEKQKENV